MFEPGSEAQTKQQKKLRARFHAFRRLSILLAALGATIAASIGFVVHRDQGQSGAVARSFAVSAAAIQLLPALGHAWSLPSGPPKSMSLRSLWMMWVILSLVALIFGILAIVVYIA